MSYNVCFVKEDTILMNIFANSVKRYVTWICAIILKPVTDYHGVGIFGEQFYIRDYTD